MFARSLLVPIATVWSLTASASHLHHDTSDFPVDNDGCSIEKTLPQVLEVPLSYDSTNMKYLISLSIGSDEQTVQVILDTGSEELVVNSNCSQGVLTSNDASTCLSAGTYNPKMSNTSTITNETNYIDYASGTVYFEYINDNVTISGTDIDAPDLQFGLESNGSASTYGICGVGFGQYYPNFIDTLQAQNQTEGKAFGVALGASNGSIVFGGVDTGKYSGSIQKIDLIAPDELPAGVFGQYPINLTSIGMTGSDGSSTIISDDPIVVQPDTGCPSMGLPPSAYVGLLQGLQEYLYGEVDETNLQLNFQYGVHCEILSQNGTLDLGFGSYTFKIPFRAMVVQQSAEVCYLQVLALESSGFPYCLGFPFLHSAYVVFDQDTPAVWVAQFNDCGTNVREFQLEGQNSADLTGQC